MATEICPAHLSQVTRGNFTNNGAKQRHQPPDMMY